VCRARRRRAGRVARCGRSPPWLPRRRRVLLASSGAAPVGAPLSRRRHTEPHVSTRREPDVDVVIPAHDEAGIIADAVRSALAQSRPPARVIVVADSCTDDTADVARGAGADVIEVSAGSPAGARNAGITAAGAELVAFLDADDLWRPTW